MVHSRSSLPLLLQNTKREYLSLSQSLSVYSPPPSPSLSHQSLAAVIRVCVCVCVSCFTALSACVRTCAIAVSCHVASEDLH